MDTKYKIQFNNEPGVHKQKITIKFKSDFESANRFGKILLSVTQYLSMLTAIQLHFETNEFLTKEKFMKLLDENKLMEQVK